MQLLRTTLPLVVLATLHFGGAFFAYFETVYLGDQYAMFGETKIAIWTWVFRGLTTLLFVSSLVFAGIAVKRILA